jgi:hypothetical protein
MLLLVLMGMCDVVAKKVSGIASNGMQSYALILQCSGGKERAKFGEIFFLLLPAL